MEPVPMEPTLEKPDPFLVPDFLDLPGDRAGVDLYRTAHPGRSVSGPAGPRPGPGSRLKLDPAPPALDQLPNNKSTPPLPVLQ